MKILVPSYTFNAAAKTITSASFTSLEGILIITNVTDNIIIYNFADPTKGGALSGTTLTLDYDTTTMADADKLQIFVDDGETIVETRPESTSWRAGFDKVVAADGVDTDKFTLVTAGTGQDVSQSAGSLVFTSGTTARAESIVRSTATFDGDMFMRYAATLSQRIANNNFYVELVDVIGDGLSYTINSATSLTVTIPSNPFTSANVGQAVYIGAFAGTGTFISERYPIASVSGNNVTFTVAGFAAGTGTCSIWGWNYHHVLYTGTTATQAAYDTQRNGWRTGDTTATINTTASGHVGIMSSVRGSAAYLDSLGTTLTTVEIANRASRARNIPDTEVPLYIQIRAANGATAPASTTTFSIGFVEIDRYTTTPVHIAGVTPTSLNAALPVQLTNTPAVTMTGTTITSLVPGVAATSLGKARDSAAAATDTGIATLYIRRDTPTALTPAAGDYETPQIDAYGATWVRIKTSTSSTTTSVASSITNVTVLASNAQRQGATIYNDSTSAYLYLKLGATASSSSFTLKMDPESYFEVPFNYTGIIDGIWTAAVGSARITEVTS